MTERFRPFDVVKFRKDLVKHSIAAGTRATVLEVHEGPSLAYEVEVADKNGQSLFVGAVAPDYLELVTPDT